MISKHTAEHWMSSGNKALAQQPKSLPRMLPQPMWLNKSMTGVAREALSPGEAWAADITVPNSQISGQALISQVPLDKKWSSNIAMALILAPAQCWSGMSAGSSVAPSPGGTSRHSWAEASW